MIPQFFGDRRYCTLRSAVLVKRIARASAPVQIYYGFLPDSPIRCAPCYRVPVHQLTRARAISALHVNALFTLAGAIDFKRVLFA